MKPQVDHVFFAYIIYINITLAVKSLIPGVDPRGTITSNNKKLH